MSRKVVIRRRPAARPGFEAMTERAEGASLPYMDRDPAVVSPAQRRIVYRSQSRVEPENKGPSEMTQVVFGSLAPSVQPAINWLGTQSGHKVLATGTVALGALAVTRLLNA